MLSKGSVMVTDRFHLGNSGRTGSYKENFFYHTESAVYRLEKQ